MMQVNVTGGQISPEEREAYIARANTKYPIGTAGSPAIWLGI